MTYQPNQLTANEDAMANKSNFTPDEWKKVLSSPMLAGMAVTLADPSGLWGMMKEGMASARALKELKVGTGSDQRTSREVSRGAN